MLTVQSARKLASHIADRYRSLGTDELRIQFIRMACEGQDEEVWRAFRSAYFDALWAGAEEMSAGPVITGSSSRKGWRLSAAGNITLSFTATDRLELVDMNVEIG